MKAVDIHLVTLDKNYMFSTQLVCYPPHAIVAMTLTLKTPRTK